MSNDYRNTMYCPELEDLADKKLKVVNMIKKQYPRARDMHAYISKNDYQYKMEFMKAYNCKCGYCGVAISIVPKEMFEIDHYIYEKSKKFCGKKAAAGFIENLLLACHYCNHKKGSFEIPDKDMQYLYPDGTIMDTFKRDEKYYIRIADTFIENKTVVKFYEQVRLGSEIHRIDFLLMNMIGLLDKTDSNSKTYNELGKIIEKLRIKRNIKQ